MIEQGLAWFLESDPGVVLLAGFRIYPAKAPQAETRAEYLASFPHLTYLRTDTPAVWSFAGPDTQEQARVQLECWGLRYIDAKRLARRCRWAVGGAPNGTRLDGFRGRWGGLFFVQSCKVESERDDFIPPADASDNGVYVTTLDLLIVFEAPEGV